MRHVLDNGLTVLLKQNRAAPVVAYQAWVNAGSADETDAEAGLAHVHEHMLFKGTARRGVGEIARDVESAGGDINAWTGFDQTVYHLVMASREFPVGLDILSDALRHSAFDPEELSREQEVILEEIKRTYDMPSRRAARALFDLAYTAHPYRRPVIGFEDTVRGFSRDDVLAFYGKHYRPDNVTLILVGDFETDHALGQVQEWFGDWTGTGAEIPHTRVEEPGQSGLRVRALQEDVREAYVELAWHVPAVRHEDVAALDLLSVVLSHGDSSRLVKALQRKAHLANDVGGYAYTPKDPGLLMLSTTSAPEKARACLEGMLEVIGQLQTELVSQAELDKARHLIEAETIYQQETVQGQARRLGFFETVAGSVDFESEYYRRIRRLTPEDLRRIVNTYVHNDNLSAVAMLPEGAELTEDILREVCEARGAKPTAATDAPPAGVVSLETATDVPATARPVTGRGEILESRLSSGARLIVQQDRSVPLVAMRGVFLGGQRFETPENTGLNALMARSLTAGTSKRDSDEIAELVDGWAGSLTGVSGRNSFGLHGEMLSRYFEEGLDLFAECLTDSVFPEAELDTERGIQIEEIRAQEDNPVGLAFGLFARTRYDSHPYRMDVRGDPEVLTGLTPQTLIDYRDQHYQLQDFTLAVVGDVDPEEVAALAEKHFGRTGPGSTTPEIQQDPAFDAPRRAHRPLDKAQSHVVVGFPGVRLSDDRRFALEVLSTVLSGQSGRLFLELRDKRSMAYSVSSFSLEGIDPGYFAVYIGCSPEKVDDAVDGIRAELAKLRDVPISEAELQRAIRYLVGTHQIGLQRASARASLMAFNSAYGLGPTAHLDYAGHIEAITAQDVQAVAREILDPSREVVASVGPVEEAESDDAATDEG